MSLLGTDVDFRAIIAVGQGTGFAATVGTVPQNSRGATYRGLLAIRLLNGGSKCEGNVYMVVDGIRMNMTDGALVCVFSPVAGTDVIAANAADQIARDFVKAMFRPASQSADAGTPR